MKCKIWYECIMCIYSEQSLSTEPGKLVTGVGALRQPGRKQAYGVP